MQLVRLTQASFCWYSETRAFAVVVERSLPPVFNLASTFSILFCQADSDTNNWLCLDKHKLQQIMVQTDKTDSKPEGGGGENGNATGNSQQQQPQPIQPLPSYGVPVMMGGGVPTMMGPMGASPMMMGDMMAMMAMGGGHPGGSFAPLVGGGGPPAPLGPGYPPNMPAWMTPPNHGGVDDEGGTSDGAVYGDAAGGGVAGGNAAGDGEAAGAKGKKSKKEAYKEERKSALASRIMKRRRTSPYEKGAGGKNAKEEPFEDVHVELMSESWKKEVLEKLPRCKAAEGIRETSYYSATPKGRSKVASTAAGGGTGRGRYGYRGAGAASAAGVGASSNIGCLRKLLSELNRMEYEDAEQLPGGTAPIWVRYDDECPQYMRALITGPPRDTPYSNGLFAFDIFVPNSYPAVAPEVQLLTTGGGTVGFGPNLYRNGKVCLSLLNTWSGPKWDPGRSSILQILVSIQGLILGVEHPYYMEVSLSLPKTALCHDWIAPCLGSLFLPCHSRCLGLFTICFRFFPSRYVTLFFSCKLFFACFHVSDCVNLALLFPIHFRDMAVGRGVTANRRPSCIMALLRQVLAHPKMEPEEAAARVTSRPTSGGTRTTFAQPQ